MVYERTYDYLAERLSTHLSEGNLAMVRRAYQLAEQSHTGQMRDEGTPYILHPIRVAVSLVDELRIYSPTLVCGALLHDVIEDSPVTRDDVATGFGDEVAEIVWLLTKFEDVSLPAYLAAIEAASRT
ncbi:MAG TPA: HD domain-containing protein, partial [Blastocatellia bacterium]